MNCSHHERFQVKLDSDEITICVYCHCLKLQTVCISVQDHLDVALQGSSAEQSAMRALAGDHLDRAAGELCDVLTDPLLPWDV